jgi:hypothetical protein
LTSPDELNKSRKRVSHRLPASPQPAFADIPARGERQSIHGKPKLRAPGTPTAPPEDLGRLLPLPECARLSGLKVSTWRSWVLHRRVPFYRVGGRSIRVAEADLIRLMAEWRVPAREEL